MITEIVDMLGEADALQLGESPWRSQTDQEDIYPVDWDRLVEYDGEVDGYFRDLDGDFLGEIGTATEEQGKAPGPDAEGWDICAWYQPIHFFADRWGIYVLEQCVFDTAHRIARLVDRQEFMRDQGRRHFSPAHILLRAALLAYYYHEHYHHRIECLGLRLHVTTGGPRYPAYVQGVYRQNLNSDLLLEEALANANSHNKLGVHKKLPRSVRHAVRRYFQQTFPSDPPGYRMAMNYLTPGKFDDGENLLQGQVKEAVLAPNQPAWHWEAGPHLTRSFFGIKSDIWWVVPRGSRPRLPAGALPKSCSDADLIKLYKRAGWTEDSSGGKGSHMTVPTGRDLRPGFLSDALKRLGPFRLQDLPGLLNGSIRLSS